MTMLATIHDDTWNVLNMQHITSNSKRWDYSDISGGGHNSGLGLSQWEKALHSNESSNWLRPHPEQFMWRAHANSSSINKCQSFIWILWYEQITWYLIPLHAKPFDLQLDVPYQYPPKFFTCLTFQTRLEFSLSSTLRRWRQLTD